MALLRFGTRSTSFLAKKTGLNRGTAYVVLHTLLEKGVITKSTDGSVQCFHALEPAQLLRYLERREDELALQKENLSKVMGALSAIVNPLTSKPSIRYFDGVEGARTALEDTLSSQERTLRAFLSIYDITQVLGVQFFNDYTAKRVKNGYTFHGIRTLEKDKEASLLVPDMRRYLSSKKERREIRYLSDDLAFPTSLYMYDNKVCIISSREESFALIVESREVCEMQKKLFQLLWASAKSDPVIASKYSR